MNIIELRQEEKEIVNGGFTWLYYAGQTTFSTLVIFYANLRRDTKTGRLIFNKVALKEAFMISCIINGAALISGYLGSLV